MAKLNRKLVCEIPLIVGQGTPLQIGISLLVYGDVHTLPPFGLESMSSYKEIHVLNY